MPSSNNILSIRRNSEENTTSRFQSLPRLSAEHNIGVPTTPLPDNAGSSNVTISPEAKQLYQANSALDNLTNIFTEARGLVIAKGNNTLSASETQGYAKNIQNYKDAVDSVINNNQKVFDGSFSFATSNQNGTTTLPNLSEALKLKDNPFQNVSSINKSLETIDSIRQEIGKSTTFTPNRPDPQPSLGGTQPEVEDAQGSDRLRELMTTRQTTGTVIPRSPPAIGRNEDGTTYLIENPNTNPMSTGISNAMSLFNRMR